MTLDVLVTGQSMRIGSTHVISNNSQEFVKFVFYLSNDWKDLTAFAQFRQGNESYNVYLDSENSCYLPAEINAGKATMMLYGTGGTVIGTTNAIEFTVSDNLFISDAQSTEITESLYQQLVNEVRAAIPTGGTVGQVLTRTSDNKTAWTDAGTPTAEQTAAAVQDYLDAHPEATTTVQDGSITKAKLTTELATEITKNTEDLSDVKSALSYNAVYSAGLLIRDKYITATGEESSYTNWSCTDFLPVKPTQRLYVMSSRQSSYNKFYTANKTAIGTNDFSVEVGENYIDVPSNAAYVRLSNTTAAMDSATIRIIPEIAPAVLAQDNRNDGFFGVLFSVEQGNINTSTGQESSSTDRCRSAFLSLSSQNIVHSEVPFHLVKYNPDKSFNSTVTSNWINQATAPEDGLYKLLFQSGSVSSVEEGLYIETPSVIPTLKEIVGNINSNSPAEYNFHAYDAANNISLSNVRAFANEVVPAGQYIESITFHQRSLSAAITNKIEIWGKSGDTLTLLDTITYVNTVSEEKDVELAYGKMFSVDTMIAIVYGASFTIFAMTAASGNQRDIRTTDKTSTTLNYSGIGKISYRVCVSAKVVKSAAYLSNFADRLAGVPYNIVRIGAGEKFTEIQDALNFITDDSPSKPYVFQIMPGTYKKFDMTLKPGVRYISMIGTCKKDCIIQDDSGQYYNAPALVYTNGMFKNLTFIATHDTPPALADRENAKHKAYALHMDCGTQDVLFEDCVFVSYQAPAVGIGCYQDVKYHFKNCEMYSYTPAYDETDTDFRTNWTLMANYGALFAHSNTGNNVTNQRLVLDNCRMYSQYGNRGMELTTAGDFQNSEMLLSLMGNMAISYAEGSIKAGINPALTIQPESFGNNWNT